MSNMDISVVIPCLNEEETIGACVKKAISAIKDLKLNGEVVVSDNGSTDKSIEISKSLGARVVHQKAKGYGNAYLKGLSSSKGKYIVMADGDDTYDLSKLGSLIKELDKGYDMVIGSRFMGKMLPGAMSWSHRYIGNPILTCMLNLFFNSHISDAHSGYRAITKEAFGRLGLKTGGMEFASEMIIEALRKKLKIKEIPITYHLRKGESKLNSFSDAWRHVRFMLIYSPTYLFFIPGAIPFCLGMLGLISLLLGSFTFLGHRFDVHAMVLMSFLAILGFQVINLGLYAKTYAILEGFEEENLMLKNFYGYFNLEKGIIFGLLLFIIGLFVNVYILYQWSKTGFEALNELRPALFALTFMVIGLQTIFSSFFLSLMGMQKGKVD